MNNISVLFFCVLGYNLYMNDTRSKDSGTDQFSAAAIIYVSAVYALHPLIMHKGYFDITEAKAAFYTGITAAYILSLVMLAVCGERIYFSKPGKAVTCLWIYFAVYTVSSLAFGNGREVFIAADNRYQGIGMTLLYAVSVYLISKSYIWKDRRSGFVFYSAAAALLINGIFGIMNYYGVDPFGLYRHMSVFESRKFFSGIGNVDFISAYLSLFIPVFVFITVSEFKELKRWEKTLYITACIIGFAALPISSSSVYIGLGCSAILFPLLSVKLKTGRCPRIYTVILVILLIVFLAALVLYNTAFREAGGIAGKYLVIDSDWGSDRGKIWAHVLNMFREFAPLQKLIGGGSGCIAAYDKNLRIFPDAILDSAHNEYLNILVNSGILGLTACLGFLLFCILKALKSQNAYKYALLLGMLSYMAQAAVNIAQPMTTPLFVTAAALITAEDH